MASATVLGRIAMAGSESEELSQFTGGAAISEGGVEIDIASFVEDGHSVPIIVRADGAEAIGLFALLNPTPELAIIRFTRLSATRAMSTKIRLAASQDVIAVARMGDGTFRRATKHVSVALGGCNV
ncbi:MAG: thiosulfate oxidation carrier protein SoxY [Paracoccaceae bacterium]